MVRNTVIKLNREKIVNSIKYFNQNGFAMFLASGNLKIEQ
jgi:hypothetical protein